MAIPQNNVRAIMNVQGNRVGLPFTEDMAEWSCPFGMYLGYSINTPDGEVRWDAKVNDYALYQRVLSGSDSISVLWEDANEIVNKQIKKSVGRINKVYITDNTISYAQSNLAASNDLVSTQAVNTFEAYSEGHYFTTTDIFRLHMFPRRFGRQLFIAESIEEQRGNDGAILYQTISFKSLQNELATSGLAVEQFVHFGAVGYDYAMPRYNDKEDKIELETRSKLEGVNECQIEFYGNVAPCSIAFGGRNVGEDVDKNELIVPCVMLPAMPSAFSNSAAPSTNYYMADDMKISLEGRYADYKQAISAAANAPFEKRQFEGVFYANVVTGQHTSDPYGDAILQNSIMAQSMDISKIPSYNNYFYTSDTSNTKRTAFTAQTPISLLWRTHLCYQHLTEIPMSGKTSVKFNLSQVPILGGLINTLTFGLLPDTNIVTEQKKIQGIPALVEAQTFDFGTSLLPTTGAGVKRVPLDWFRNEDSGEMAAALSTKAMNTAFRFSLTKRFADKANLNIYSAPKEETYTFNDAFDDVVPEFGTNKKKFKDNTTAVHIDGKLENYIISQMYMKVIGAADYRLTFFRDGNPVWTGRYQTKAKRSSTGSVHQIQHEMILDPINKIKGSEELMHNTKLNVDAKFLNRTLFRTAVNKTTTLNKHWTIGTEPDPVPDPINPEYMDKIVIPISSLYGLGETPKSNQALIVKGYFEKGGYDHRTERFTLEIPYGNGFKDGVQYVGTRRHEYNRFGVEAVIDGTDLVLISFDTGTIGRITNPKQGTSLGEPVMIDAQKQSMVVHWETINVVPKL